MTDFRSEIYNKQDKERFLSTIDLKQYPAQWWERVFRKSCMFEKLHDKDLYSFTVSQILEFYKYLDISSIASLVVYNTNLVKYAQWALNENLVKDGMNHFDEIDTETLALCLSVTRIQQSYLSYDRFNTIISKMENEQDRFIFWCLFEGIKGKDYCEILNLKIIDIDTKKRIVKLCTGREMKVSQKFIDCAFIADLQTTYRALTFDKDREYELKLLPSDTIYKNKERYYSETNQGQLIYRTVYRNINYMPELKKCVTAKSIGDSGMIYYLNNRADELRITTEELLYQPDKCSDIVDKYLFNIYTRKRWIMQYKAFLH